MSTINAVVYKLISLFIIVITGYFLRRKNIVSQEFSAGISGFLTKVVLPVFFVMAMQISFTPERLQTGIKVYIFSLIMVIISMIIGFITATIFGIKGAEKGIWIYSCLLPNHAFIGFPIMEVIFGQEGMFYAVFANTALNTIAFSIGVVIIGIYAQDKSKKKSIKQLLLTPMNIGTIVGIVFFLFKIHLPKPVADSCNMLVDTMSALAMLFVGMVLAEYPFAEMFKGSQIYKMTFVRLILIPLCICIVIEPFNGILDKTAIGIIIISHALPVGSIAATVAAEYSDNPIWASKYIFITTFLCVLTIPLISLLII